MALIKNGVVSILALFREWQTPLQNQEETDGASPRSKPTGRNLNHRSPYTKQTQKKGPKTSAATILPSPERRLSGCSLLRRTGIYVIGLPGSRIRRWDMQIRTVEFGFISFKWTVPFFQFIRPIPDIPDTFGILPLDCAQQHLIGLGPGFVTKRIGIIGILWLVSSNQSPRFGFLS